MDRAYSLLTVKAIEDRADEWTITGVASTPTPDRMGDVVEPLGAKFKLPMPLLWQHQSDLPVGRVEFAKPTTAGIPFVARLPKVAEAGALRDRIEEAVQSIKYRLVGAVSIGFRGLAGAIENLKDGGLRFKEWEWLELSLVTIPANADATITSIKSLDSALLAATGRAKGGVGNPPGDSGRSTNRPKGNTMKTMQELREERSTKAARMQELVELFRTDGHETSDDETAEFDELSVEVKTLDQDIRIAQFHAMQSAAAKSVDGSSAAAGSASRGGVSFVRKQDPDDAFKGQSYTRLLIAKAAAFIAMKDGNFVSAADVAKHRWGKTHPKLVEYVRTAVAGGGTGSGEWGAELVQSDARFTGDFIEYLYSKTLFDTLPLRSVPARVHIKGQDGASTGYWVGESKAIPVGKSDYSSVELTPLKVAAISVCSKELVRDSSPSAEMLIRDDIAQASSQRVDTTFFSTTAASSGVSPAGLLNGLTALAPSGTDSAAVRADLMSLYADFLTAKNASGLVQVMTPSMAKAISLMVNSLGQTEFPNLGAMGGTLLGDTVYTGDNVTGGYWLLMKCSDIWKIGNGGMEVSISDQATIEQNDAPQGAGDTPTAASATLMSLWQTEQIGFKVVRSINYQKRRSGAVKWLDNAEYGGVVS